jgi:NADH-quinone oxidoreductase subunit A
VWARDARGPGSAFRSDPVPGELKPFALRGCLRCDTRLRHKLGARVAPAARVVRCAVENLKSEAMPSLISDYMPLVVFIVIAALIGGALLIAPFLVAYRAPDNEKLSPYECGFPPFDDARMRFDARFYLVSLLFIIFDLEVAFLFPWAIVFHDLGALGFWSMMIFLAVLTIGFVYEWNKGALEWD